MTVTDPDECRTDGCYLADGHTQRCIPDQRAQRHCACGRMIHGDGDRCHVCGDVCNVSIGLGTCGWPEPCPMHSQPSAMR